MNMHDDILDIENALLALDTLTNHYHAAARMADDTPQPIVDAMAVSLGAEQLIGQEGIGSFLGAIFDGILNFFRMIGEKLSDLWKAIFSNSHRNARRAEATERKVEAVIKEKGAGAQAQVSANVRQTETIKDSGARAIEKVTAINDELSKALEKGNITKALDMMEDIIKNGADDAKIDEIAKLIGDTAGSIADLPEIRKSPIYRVRKNDDRSRVTRHLIEVVGDKGIYADVTTDSRNNVIKVVMGSMPADADMAKLMNVQHTPKQVEWIPADQAMAMVAHARDTFKAMSTAMGGRGKARKGDTSALFNRMKELKSDLSGVEHRYKNSEGNELKALISKEQALKIQSIMMTLNEMVTKGEFQESQINAEITKKMAAIVNEIDSVEFK